MRPCKQNIIATHFTFNYELSILNLNKNYMKIEETVRQLEHGITDKRADRQTTFIVDYSKILLERLENFFFKATPKVTAFK